MKLKVMVALLAGVEDETSGRLAELGPGKMNFGTSAWLEALDGIWNLATPYIDVYVDIEDKMSTFF